MDSCCKQHESMLSTPTALLVATQIGFCKTNYICSINASSLVHVVTTKFFYVPTSKFYSNSANVCQFMCWTSGPRYDSDSLMLWAPPEAAKALAPSSSVG